MYKVNSYITFHLTCSTGVKKIRRMIHHRRNAIYSNCYLPF